MLNYKTITTTSLLTLFVISVFNLVSANILSTKGLTVAMQEKEVLKLEKENRRLKTQIEESTRLSDIEFTSHNLGFIGTGHVVYMQTVSDVALK